MKSKTHKLAYRISFSKAVTKAEALAAIKDSGGMGIGADDYFQFSREDGRDLHGTFHVRAIKSLPKVKQ